MLSFGLIGASIKNGNMALLSALTVPEENRREVLTQLKRSCGFNELVALFTCNRVEFYYIVESLSDNPTAIRNKLLDFFLQGRPKVSFEPSDVYSYSAFRALKHLYRVAGSLDSMVVGEAQILGQVKKALSDAKEMELAGSQIEGIFTDAFRVAKKIRRETPLGKHAVSMVSLVVDAVSAHLEDRENPVVAIVGVGPMSLKLANHLHEHTDTELILVNRTESRAREAAAKVGARAMSLEQFRSRPPSVDVLFTSTASPQPILDAQTVSRLRDASDGDAELLIVDLAVPRDVEPSAAAIKDVLYRDIPYFQSRAERNRHARFAAVDEAERIVAAEIGRAHRLNAERQFRPIFASALNEGLAYARTGLEKLFSTRLPHLDEADRHAISHWVEKLVRYTNHLPVVALAEQADTSHGDCAMVAGYGCVRSRSGAPPDAGDPTAHRCAKNNGKPCVMDNISSYSVR